MLVFDFTEKGAVFLEEACITRGQDKHQVAIGLGMVHPPRVTQCPVLYAVMARGGAHPENVYPC